MRYGMWVYPWDLLDHGPRQVVDELADLGVDEMLLALSYHSVAAVMPDNPVRRWFHAAEGAVYFEPRPELWGDAQGIPPVSPLAGEDPAGATREAAAGRSLRVSAWTVVLHGASALLRTRPDVAVVTAWGDALPSACVAHPATQEYVLALVTDVAARADAVQIEAAHWMPPHHAHFKSSVRQRPLLQRLLASCVCECCRARLAGAGGDPDRLAAQLSAVAAGVFGESDGAVVPAAEIGGYLADRVADFATYDALRRDAVTSLVRSAVGCCIGKPVEFLGYGDAGVIGADYAALERAGTAIRVLAYGAANDVETTLGAVLASPSAPSSLHAGLSLLADDAPDEAAFRASHDAAAAAGVSSIAFYNYGLVTARRRRWVAARGRRAAAIPNETRMQS